MKKITLFLILLSGFFASRAQLTEALETTPVIDGYVNNIAYGDGKVFLQGSFTWLSNEPYGGNSVVFDETLTPDTSYPNNIYGLAAIADDVGGWYVLQYNTIAHVKADKTVEQLPVLADNSSIYAMVKAGNILYLGGTFISINGTARNYLAAFDLSTNTLTGWNPTSNGTVYALAAYGSTVYAGGSFTTIGGQTRNKIAAIDATTGLATSWNVGMVGSNQYYVFAIAANANTVFFGGKFFLGGVYSDFAVRDAATGTVNGFNPAPNNRVGELLLDGNTLYISGAYTQIAGVEKKYVSAFDITTGTLTPFHVDLNSYSNEGWANNTLMTITGDKLFIGGWFSTVNNTPHHYLVVVNKHTGALEPMNDEIRLSNRPYYVAASNGKILIGNSNGFKAISGVSERMGLAALDHTTGNVSEWNPAISSDDGDVANIHYQQNRVYINQQNYTYNFPNPPIYSTKLSTVNTTDGAAIPGWGVTFNGYLSNWAFSESTVYLAGSFTEINGQTRNGFAAIDLQTGNLLPWTINFTPSFGDNYSTEISLAADNNVVYMSYSTHNWDNNTQNIVLAAWNATTGAALSWAPPAMEVSEYYQNVRIGAVHGNYVYIIKGGSVLRLDKVTGQADNWKPTLNGKEISNDGYGYGVNTIAIHGNSVFLGGAIALHEDDDWQEWRGVVRASINTGVVSSWEPSLYLAGEGTVEALVATETKLLVGGDIYAAKSYYAEFLIPEFFNNPPYIQPAFTATVIGGIATLPLAEIISDEDDNLDWATLEIIVQPASGAMAHISNGQLMIDYAAARFSGIDYLTLRVCDTDNACTQQEIAIEVGGNLNVYNGISPNGDGLNDTLIIQHINALAPQNKVTIYNRWGDVVWEGKNYDNTSVVFSGLNKNEKEVPTGIYYYKIEFIGGAKTQTGYLSLKR